MSSIVNMSHIKKTYDGRRFVLSDLNFSINEGEVSTILGASGCGKSTFLNIVGLLDSFTAGEYIFNGTQIKQDRLNAYCHHRALDIGFVFQAYCLIDSISVRENILMPFLYNEQKCTKEVLHRLDDMLEKFNMAHLKDKKSSLLSGGERQRVAIARAVIKRPKLIIADEPTGNLDEANAKLVVDAFQNISKQGTAIIVVTHNKYLSFGAGRKYILEGGVLHLCEAT